MANYSHGYKKQSAEQALLKIIVGIIVAVFVFVVIAFIYKQATEWKVYDHYQILTDYDDVMDNPNAGDNYVVYLYKKSGCDVCDQIKNKVLREGNRINKDADDQDVFFIADTTSMNSSDDNAGDLDQFLSDTDQIELMTPSIVVIVDGSFYAVYTGETDVLNTLNAIDDGTYEPFN